MKELTPQIEKENVFMTEDNDNTVFIINTYKILHLYCFIQNSSTQNT